MTRGAVDREMTDVDVSGREAADRDAVIREPAAAATRGQRPAVPASLLLASPAAAVVLLAGAREPLMSLADDGRVVTGTGILAVAVLGAAIVLAVRAGTAALRRRPHGTDLAALAILAALSACVLMFAAGVRLDFLAWGAGLLALLAGGYFGLDAASSPGTSSGSPAASSGPAQGQKASGSRPSKGSPV
jgi:hypothetical protein